MNSTLKRTLTQVNLLPPENLEAQRQRRQTSLIVLAGIAVLGLLALVYVFQVFKSSDLDDQIAAQNTANARLQAETTRLQHFAELQDSVTARQTLVQGALAGDVAWSGILHDLSQVIPPDMWLDTMSATLTQGQALPVGAVPTTTVPSNIIGSIAFQGSAFDTTTLSAWLTRLEQVRGWVNPWLSQAQRAQVGSTTVFTFSSSVDLSIDVVSKRGGGSR